MVKPKPIRWFPHQQRAIDCIACWALPARQVYAYPTLERVVHSDRRLVPKPSRFYTKSLASKLARSLHTKSP